MLTTSHGDMGVMQPLLGDLSLDLGAGKFSTGFGVIEQYLAIFSVLDGTKFSTVPVDLNLEDPSYFKIVLQLL